MLSILIPCYNYNCFTLVKELHNQADLLKITFEIICVDDASNSNLNTKNEAINKLQHASFSELKENLGRSAMRNYLAQRAQYEYLLFLDADVFPKEATFLKSILKNKNASVVFGGIECSIKAPKDNSILRWKYSLQRECNDISIRLKNPYYSFTSACFFIKKHVFSSVKFDESLKKYGCEDVLFAYHLKQHNIPIIHIENPVYHDNLETSSLFINKTQLALKNLYYLTQNSKLPYTVYKISKINLIIKTYHLSPIINLIYKSTEKSILKNLNSKKPSLILFDLYRIGYLNTLNNR
jgi:glycosyltransferase involved in cell wall biosynthesis